MIQSLSDILVVADMDGTLLADDKSLPACNVATIRLFTALGGHFSVATGRVIDSVSRYPAITSCLSPVIASGGCVIYDYATDRFRRSSLLPRVVARKAVKDILKAFPAFGAVVMSMDNRLFLVSASAETSKLMRDEQHVYFHRPQEDIPPEWNKVLFAGPHEQMAELRAFVTRMDYPGVYFVATDPLYFEMMPMGVSKASALQELCDMLRIKPENTAVVGDYYNDLDMMKLAGCSVAVSNAPLDVRMQATEITASNNEGGVGQFLYRLIKKYGNR